MSLSVTLPVDDVLQTVERPVVMDVIRRVMELSRISSKTPIRFYGVEAKAAQHNSTLTKDAEYENRWPHRENIVIEVDEDIDKDHLLSTTIKGEDQHYVFLDEELGVSIKPVKMSTLVRISVKYKAIDENEAKKWRNDIATRFADSRDINIHTIEYAWHLPDSYVALLKEIHRLRENQAGYGDPFDRWFGKHSSNRVSYLTNQAGSRGFWAVSEVQSPVQGQFDFEGMPSKAEREDEPNLWVVSFDYVFRYDKPIEAVMRYPLIVHQQLLSRTFRPDTSVYSLQNAWLNYSKAEGATAKFRVDARDLVYRSNRGLTIPDFDVFLPASVPAATANVATILTTIESENKRYLLDINDLGDYNLVKVVLDFIVQSERTFVTKPYQSVVQLHLYAGTTIVNQEQLTLDASGRISTVADLDMRRVYHLRLSLVTDLTYLPDAALRRLKANPQAAALLVKAINLSLSNETTRAALNRSKLAKEWLSGLGLKYDGDNVVPGQPSASIRGDRGFIWGLFQTLFVRADRA